MASFSATAPLRSLSSPLLPPPQAALEQLRGWLKETRDPWHAHSARMVKEGIIAAHEADLPSDPQV